MLHKLRQGVSKDRVRVSNQLRGLLAEYGVIMPQGIAALRRELPLALEDADNGLSERARQLLHRQYQRFLEVEQELAWYDQQVKQRSRQDETCRRLQAIPGVGEVVASLLKGWMGDGRQFRRGRDAGAALGLIPVRTAPGAKTSYWESASEATRTYAPNWFTGARAVVARADGKMDRLSRWIQRSRQSEGSTRQPSHWPTSWFALPG